MPSNTIGNNFKITVFGESHGSCVGVVIDGCPPGLHLNEDDIQVELNKRKPTLNEFSTSRLEEDEAEILSGILKGYTTGGPVCVVIWNKEAKSDVYKEFIWKPRPGHADYPAAIKYRGYHDYRGGGIFSARITVGYVAAGAVAKKILEKTGVEVAAHVREIGGIKAKLDMQINNKATVYNSSLRCLDLRAAKSMNNAIEEAKSKGDSLGGIVECLVFNMPVGIGEPIFDSLDAALAKLLFCIPAVKAVEFGAGVEASRLKGSENNDPYRIISGKIVTETNNAGGILGGLSTGMPLVIRIAFKPPSSIPKKQKSVDLRTMTEVALKIKGRYDVCFVPRAVPIVESVVSIVLADFLIPTAKT